MVKFHCCWCKEVFDQLKELVEHWEATHRKEYERREKGAH